MNSVERLVRNRPRQRTRRDTHAPFNGKILARPQMPVFDKRGTGLCAQQNRPRAVSGEYATPDNQYLGQRHPR